MTPEERLRTPLLRKWVFRRENCAGTWTPDGIPYETRPPASNPRRRFVFLRRGCGNSPSGEKLTPEGALPRQSRTKRALRRENGVGTGISDAPTAGALPAAAPALARNRAELTPVSPRRSRQRPIVLPCPLGNDGEVWSSRRQRTRDGAHRLRGPSKADVQSSLHQPQPQSGPRRLQVGKPYAPRHGAQRVGARERKRTRQSRWYRGDIRPWAALARDGFLLALERIALWRCPMTSSPLRRR